MKKYLIRFVKHSYVDVVVEADSMDDARKRAELPLERHEKSVRVLGRVKSYPFQQDMICRVDDKGRRANIPLDEDDNEIDEVDEREWDRGK